MVVRLMPFKLKAYGLSDPGLVRQNNEDVWGCLPEHHIFVLADGMGGHQAGEIAAREAVLFFCSQLRKSFDEMQEQWSVESLVSLIRSVVEDTNHFVYELSMTDELLKGMGTTLCSLLFYEGYVIHAHVGDSRIYRLRNGHLMQLTHDHSLVRELIELGKVAEHEVGDFDYKNIITRAIGTEFAVEPTLEALPLCHQDSYLLCTDGLSDLLSPCEIEDILKKKLTVEEKVRSLIAAAKIKGGYDNVTVVLVEVTETHAPKEENLSR